jgi:hypothetical protein
MRARPPALDTTRQGPPAEALFEFVQAKRYFFQVAQGNSRGLEVIARRLMANSAAMG